ncbi:MAG TPA: EAL domain-containing protein [Dehalococcoidia bacterium]|nr:EAL domain-containing protein [Dehalococcoidia bacterium]
MNDAATAAGRRAPFWANPVGLLVAFGVVLSISGSAIVLLQERAKEQYEQTILTHRLELKAYDIMAAGWRAVLANAFPPPGQEPEAVEAEKTASLAFLDETLRSYHEDYAGLGSPEVRDRLAQYAAMHEQESDLMKAGRAFEAFGMEVAALEPFSELRTAAAEDTRRSIARAAQVDSRVHLATLGVLAFAFLSLGGISFLYRRAQHSVEVAKAEQEILRRSEARFRPLVQSSSDVIAVINDACAISYASPAIRQLAGISPEEAAGRFVVELVAEGDRASFEAFLADVHGRPNFTSMTEVRLAGDEPRFAQVVCTNRLRDPDVRGLVLNIRDVSEQKSLEEQLRHQAFHDPLTGLSNRLLFMERLEHALLRAKRNGNQNTVSVLYMDIDRFKNVNDELGHSFGDSLLRQAAARLSKSVRAGDTAARLGGDEFAVLLEDSANAGDARNTAERILEEMKRPFEVEGHTIHVTASIGVVVANAADITAEEVLRDADVAMYDAKENGRGRIQVFDPGMKRTLVEKLKLMADLNGALERNEFVVHYQPVFDLATEDVKGFEALVRWNHPVRGLLPPYAFIEAAEETGVIHALGKLVLAQATKQAREWQTRYESMAEATMSVNVSPKQLQEPEFVAAVAQALADSGLQGRHLIIEITENVLLPDPKRAAEALERVRALGVRVALDDFGTGYSSLSYVGRFPIDILKIDRGFIEGIDTGAKERMLVQTVIDLGRTLELETVAEGIERREQLASLRALDCAQGQGYLFAHPLDVDSAEAFLHERHYGRRPAEGRAA